MIRNTLKKVGYDDRREVVKDLRKVYQAPSVDAAKEALEELKDRWAKKYPVIAKSWETKFDIFTTFLQFPPGIRKLIYTTNAIESLNDNFKVVSKTKGSYPSRQAAMKNFYLCVENQMNKKGGLTSRVKEWEIIQNQLEQKYGNRYPQN